MKILNSRGGAFEVNCRKPIRGMWTDSQTDTGERSEISRIRLEKNGPWHTVRDTRPAKVEHAFSIITYPNYYFSMNVNVWDQYGGIMNEYGDKINEYVFVYLLYDDEISDIN